uniref:Metallopeptidase n=1 Tax=Pristionchus pacificus TaxID=54126 RepID=A0A2A6B563_PRIPA|eukprot:PDM60993.1 metallopeptidase [Pristionchus pacificus]
MLDKKSEVFVLLRMRLLLVAVFFLEISHGKPVTRDRAMSYLHTFGYLHPDKLNSHHVTREDQEIKLEKAVKEFQQMAGLEVTGMLDVATREKMSRPRCDERKWNKKELSYSIDNFGPGMSEEETRQTVADVLQLWAASFQLTFREVRSGRADIRIIFGRRDHGDGHMFDGEGYVLAHTFRPPIGKIHFDSEENWMRMHAQNHSFDTHKDFFSVAIHQLGHALGLQHSNNTLSIMTPFYSNPEDLIGIYERPKLDAETISNLHNLYRANSTSGERIISTAEPENSDNCMQNITAIMQLPGNRIVAFNDDGQIININSISKRIIEKSLFTEFFLLLRINGGDSLILLFDQYQVFGYKFDEEKSTIVRVHGYPKKWQLSAEDEQFDPIRSAFKARDGRIVVINIVNRIAIYDEKENSMKTLTDGLSNHFPDMPEDVVLSILTTARKLGSLQQKYSHIISKCMLSSIWERHKITYVVELMQIVYLIFFILSMAQSKPVTMHEAMNFLQKFGYLHPESLSDASSSEEEEDATYNAITNFQMIAGIEMTGKLDARTREFMSLPRCGVPDMEALKDENGNKLYLKWHKNDLTYSIDNFWHGMSEDETRKTISDAFGMWAAVIPLTFREQVRSNHSEINIRIRFGRGEHGDWEPFDGRGHTLAHASKPEIGKIHFDADEEWMRMTERNHPIYSHSDFFSVAIHEIGHAIGLGHLKDRKSIMYPTYVKPQDENGNYASPRLNPAIIQKIQEIYGKPIKHERAGIVKYQPQVPPPARHVPNIHQFCIRHVSAIARIPGNRILVFPDSKHVLTVNSLNKHIIGTGSISRIFMFGPFDVSSIIYNTVDSMILIFDKNLVYGYKLNVEQNILALAFGYPKILPTMQAGEFFWETKAAFIIPDGRRIVVNTNKKVAIYNEHDNSIRVLSGTIRDVFPNMQEDVVGFVDFSHGTHVGFTSSDVFKYDFETHTIENLGKIHDHMGC